MQLFDFLVELATSADAMSSYRRDPRGALTTAGLSDEEQSAVLKCGASGQWKYDRIPEVVNFKLLIGWTFSHFDTKMSHLSCYKMAYEIRTGK